MSTANTQKSLSPVRFSLGRIVATPGAIHAMSDAGVAPSALLNRHVVGDWGDVCPADAKQNDRAVRVGERLLSAYKITPDVTVWVITEWDRSCTTFLLPEEY